MNDKSQKFDKQRTEEDTKNPFREKEISEENKNDDFTESSETAEAEQQRKKALTERD